MSSFSLLVNLMHHLYLYASYIYSARSGPVPTLLYFIIQRTFTFSCVPALFTGCQYFNIHIQCVAVPLYSYDSVMLLIYHHTVYIMVQYLHGSPKQLVIPMYNGSYGITISKKWWCNRQRDVFFDVIGVMFHVMM